MFSATVFGQEQVLDIISWHWKVLVKIIYPDLEWLNSFITLNEILLNMYLEDSWNNKSIFVNFHGGMEEITKKTGK